MTDEELNEIERKASNDWDGKNVVRLVREVRAERSAHTHSFEKVREYTQKLRRQIADVLADVAVARAHLQMGNPQLALEVFDGLSKRSIDG